MRAPIAALAAAAALLAGCGGGGGDGGFSSATQATETLVGTWRATKAEFRNSGNSSQRVDIVARGSMVTLALEAGGTYRMTIVDPGEAGNTVTGTWTSSRDVLTIVQTGRSWNTQFDMVFSGSTLTLTGGHVLFDVNGDGAGEECLLDMALVRQ
jgi:Lipocalin-like domain